ncbi:NAD(P)-dependent dehydrogenase (short-subunit alcohol dehydrogenase family) [Sphingomonas jejuensis]|uniref:NAD(P)-dependent dehydrogenase (Short-subunit alcohol dehydrogenase family) n=1 Tax=Sphingomonas jejuensis TaxID=904715 RepID=A0ABX0XJ22_9SPHN|nr:SDR family oxidoreductase [Sphingomonas jejuensis]NJC32872.1 NAD(P)-dependent dehydrogenase (short-subunit alcohol dehydrogenase family) [Sphingomonas jejuensis]
MIDDPTRRTLIGGAAIGLAAAATPAMGQNRSSGGAAAAPTPASRPVDPQTKYTRQPFPEQRQDWPGLARDMNPRPDHGETSYRGSGRLAGRGALITGGDSGIGRAAAIAYAREGADVAINYHPDEQPDADEVVALIRQAGRRAVAVPADIRTERACNAMVERAIEQLGGLDILVNNAAYQQSKASIMEISAEQFDRTFKTNVYATFWISKAAIPAMQPGSAIINTISVNSWTPGEELLDYASTKGALLIFTRGLAKQLAKRGIRVNAVAPGPVWTPLQVAGGQLPGQMGQFGQDTPLGRAGQPAELAALFVTMASGESSFTTGSVIGAHGGDGQP